MLDRTKRLTTAIALLASLLVSLPVAQGQANANEMQTKIETKVAVKSIVAIAKQYIGTPYCRGGQSPRCFDCSGFTQYVYKKKGKEIARTTAGQYKESKKVSSGDVQVGDLVFFFSSGGNIYHVGIYAGNGEVIHSPKPGRPVKIEKIWTKRIQFRRL